jgi:hypothetical protein
MVLLGKGERAHQNQARYRKSERDILCHGCAPPPP